MNGRRWFLKRAAMAPAAMAAMPGVVVQTAAEATGLSMGSLGGPQAMPSRPAWERAGMPKALWRMLDRERDLRNWRTSVYRNALLGVVEGDIAGMASLSPVARARMQRDRITALQDADEKLRLRLWPQDDDE